MGVGSSSKVRPKVSDSDISFKSLEDKPSHRKKPGLVRFIIDALLGDESSSSDSDLGFARFSESPDSGADFEIEEAFVDAPLPSSRSGKDTKSEKKLTPGRARTKRKGIASQYSTSQSVHFVDEVSSTPCPQGEGHMLCAVMDEPDVTRVNTSEVQVFDKAVKCVPSSHGRGDNAALEDNNPKVEKDYLIEDLVVPRTSSNASNFQKNCKESGGGFPATDAQEAQPLDKQVEVYQVSKKRSDKLNSENGGREATFSTENDSDQFSIREKKTLIACTDVNPSNTISEGNFTTEMAIVIPPTERQKPILTSRPAHEITKCHQSNRIMSELDRKRVDMFTVGQRASEDIEAPDSTCSHHGQSYNKMKFASSGVSRPTMTTALSTIKKMMEDVASSSSKVLITDSGTCNHRDKDTEGSAASDMISFCKSDSTTPHTVTASGSADKKTSYVKFRRAQAIRRRRYLEKKSEDRSKKLKKSYDSTSIGEASYMKTAWSKRLNGSEKEKDPRKQGHQSFAPSPPAYKPTFHLDLVYPNKVMQKSATDETKVGPLDAQETTEQRVTSSKSTKPKSSCQTDGEVVSDETKETQENKQETVVPKLFEVQLPSVAELEIKVEEAKKELNSIRKYLRSKQDKHVKTANAASNLLKFPVNGKTLTHSLLNSSTGDARVPVCDKDDVKTQLLHPVSDKEISRSVVFNGKKEDKSTDETPARTNKSKEARNKASPNGGEKKNPTALGKRRGQGLEKSRKALGRRLAARLGKTTPSGEGGVKDLLPSKSSASNSEVDQLNERLIAKTCAVALRLNSDVVHPKFSQDTARQLGPYRLHLFNQVRGVPGRGFDDKPKRAISKNGPFSKQGRSLINIKRQRLSQPKKHPKHPLVPNLHSEAVTDFVMDGLAIMWMEPMTWDFLNGFMIVLADLLLQMKRSSMEYFQVANASNTRGLNVTRLLDRDLMTIFQRIRWERQRPAMLFNAQFRPRRPFQPYFDGIRYIEFDFPENDSEPGERVEANVETVAVTVHTESRKAFCERTKHASENVKNKELKAAEFLAKGPIPAYAEAKQESEQIKVYEHNDGVPTRTLAESDSKSLKGRKRYLDPDESKASHGEIKTTSTETKLEFSILGNTGCGMKTQGESNSKCLKVLDLPGNHASDVDTKATKPDKTNGKPGTLTKSVGKTINDDNAQIDDEPPSKKDVGATNQKTVSNDEGSRTNPAGGNTKKVLGRGPRIVGNVRRIVHCRRNRRTDKPTTQLKIKFCLGCGDTKQPNGEPLIMCATCDEAFFCCTKCQRATRNAHRETCKGVKRHYCKHV